MKSTLLNSTILMFAWACLPLAADGASPEPPDGAVAVVRGAFVERATGRPFHPRGFNYVRLFPQRSHNTFDPEHYDDAAVEETLERWRRDGFNAVRVFLNASARLAGSLAEQGKPGLSSAYLENVADFLDRAGRNGIAVMLCTEGFPKTAPYSDALRRSDSALDEANASYLAAGHVEAKARFLQDLVRGLHASSPSCLGAVFSYDLQNEFCYHGGPPFTLPSGSLVVANGKTYALPDQRSELADDGAIYFIDRMADAIHEVHPRALVSASVFTYAAVGRSGPGDFSVKPAAWQNRIPFRPLAILRSKADFVDLHFYSADAAAWERDLASVEFDEVRGLARKLGKPLVVGEFGAFKRPFPAIEGAAAWMGDLAAMFGKRGFAGWLYWTYDTHEQSGELWHARDAEGAIYERLKGAVQRP